MRFKQLLLTGLAAACITGSALADPPYIAAVVVDSSTYSYYRYSITWPEYNPYPSLTDPLSNPYPWANKDYQIRIDPDTAVTSAYWWAVEEWKNEPYTHAVYKNYYARSNHIGYSVPDHYAPVQGKSLYIGTPDSGHSYLGMEVTGGMRIIYAPGLLHYSNTYYVYNNDGSSYAITYEDGSVYIYNG